MQSPQSAGPQDSALKTFYAPAQRSTPEDLQREAAYIITHPYLKAIADATPNALVILDKNRQIVFANEALARILGLKKADDALGCRTGELLKCAHASASEGNGCGTTLFCKYCGAAQSIMRTQAGTNAVEECRITCEDGAPLDLRVWTTPLNADGEHFTVFALNDISDEKRRQALERIFFHDILNTAGGIQGISDIIRTSSAKDLDMLIDMIGKASNTLIDEIGAQKQLMAAESAELEVNAQEVESLALLRDVVAIYTNHTTAMGKHVEVSPASANFRLTTDKALLRRVVGNLVKNALEATREGKTVTISCEAAHGEALFHVHNADFMPESVQMQVFQRSFSTKGKGRGLGTYSIKLLTEKYLKGSVSFTTSPENGTTFTARYPLTRPE